MFKHSPKILSVIALGLVVVMVAVAPVALAQNEGNVGQEPVPGENAYAEIYNNVSPSVVAISVTFAANQPQDTGFFQLPSPQQPQGALGSGFVIDTDGHIVTNAHVVKDAQSIEVSFYDGTLVRANAVGIDEDSDIAVIKVDLPADKLQPATLGNSDDLFIGQDVLAIGSPFGERWTLTSGIVSGLDRVINGLDKFSISGVIQTDAAINPGNSGGPLLNMDGEVVGVNSQILSGSGSNSGVGFAIPSNLVQRRVAELIEKGYVEYSYVGLTGTSVTLDVMDAYELPNDFQGVMVAEVSPGSPADRAGLQNAETSMDGSSVTPKHLDILTAINGESLHGMPDLIAYLGEHTSPGDTVTFSVLRDGKEHLTVDVRLIPRP